MKIWKDGYKTPRAEVAIQKIQQKSNTVLLTFVSDFKEIGVLTIRVSRNDYQKAGSPTFDDYNEIRVITEGKAARKACHITEDIPVIMLDRRSLIDVPITALRVMIDHFNERQIQLIGSVVSWSIRKNNSLFSFNTL